MAVDGLFRLESDSLASEFYSELLGDRDKPAEQTRRSVQSFLETRNMNLDSALLGNCSGSMPAYLKRYPDGVEIRSVLPGFTSWVTVRKGFVFRQTRWICNEAV
jgi:hypothetical protein